MRILIVSLFFMISSIMVYSQSSNPGYVGKKCMLKLNLINGVRPLYLGGEIEYTVHRKLSIGVGGGYLTSTYNQTYFEQYDASPPGLSGYEIYWARKVAKAGAIVNSYSLYAQVKYFPLNTVVPAPNGFYIGAKGGGGSADIESSSGKVIKIPMGSTPPNSWSVKGIPFGYVETGVGYQKVWFKRLVLDASAYINFSMFNPGGSDYSKQYTSTISPDFGPNTLWAFPSYDNGEPDLGGAKKQPLYTTNVGLSLYVKVGILLF